MNNNFNGNIFPGDVILLKKDDVNLILPAYVQTINSDGSFTYFPITDDGRSIENDVVFAAQEAVNVQLYQGDVIRVRGVQNGVKEDVVDFLGRAPSGLQLRVIKNYINYIHNTYQKIMEFHFLNISKNRNLLSVLGLTNGEINLVSGGYINATIKSKIEAAYNAIRADASTWVERPVYDYERYPEMISTMKK